MYGREVSRINDDCSAVVGYGSMANSSLCVADRLWLVGYGDSLSVIMTNSATVSGMKGCAVTLCSLNFPNVATVRFV